MSKTLLLVDDDLLIRQAFERTFADRGFQLLSADGGEAALTLMARHPVDLILADMDMPVMNGHKLLREVRTRYPSVLRVILSGFSEGKDVLDALRDGSARKYVLKPWDSAKLTGEIDKLLQLGELFAQKKLLEIFNNMSQLPTVPELYGKLTRLIEQEAGMDKVADLIEKDQSVAAKILQLANSVYFGMHTGSVRQAVIYLGLTHVKSVVLGLGIFQQFRGLGMGHFRKDVLWDHADLVNRLTHEIFRNIIRRKLLDTEATAGLLHDIGRILLLKDFSKEYSAIAGSVLTNREENYRDRERTLMGISHDEVGGFLLNWWSLPHPIVEVALFHHDPLNPAVMDQQLVAAVHVADYYAWRLAEAVVMPRLVPECYEILRVSPDACEELMRKAK